MDKTPSANFSNPLSEIPGSKSAKSRVGLSLALAGVSAVVAAMALGIFLTKATPIRHIKILALVAPLAVGGGVASVASSVLLRKPTTSKPAVSDPLEVFTGMLNKRLDSVRPIATQEEFQSEAHRIYEEDLKGFFQSSSIHEGAQAKLQGQCDRHVVQLPEANDLTQVSRASSDEKQRLQTVPKMVVKDCFARTSHPISLHVGEEKWGDPFRTLEGSPRAIQEALDLLEQAIGEKNQEWLPYLELQFTQMAQGMVGAVGGLHAWAMSSTHPDQEQLFGIKMQPVHMDVKVIKDHNGIIQEIQITQKTSFSYQQGKEAIGGGLNLDESYSISKNSEGKLQIQNYKCQISEMPNSWKP